MIYVRIELWPFGDKRSAKVLGEALIHNTGGGTAQLGEYGYQISKVGGFKASEGQLTSCKPSSGSVLRSGEIKGFPRKRLYATDLLFRVLRDAFGERNE